MNYVREEIEIKVESLKLELDKMRENSYKYLDDCKNDFEE